MVPAPRSETPAARGRFTGLPFAPRAAVPGAFGAAGRLMAQGSRPRAKRGMGSPGRICLANGQGVARVVDSCRWQLKRRLDHGDGRSSAGTVHKHAAAVARRIEECQSAWRRSFHLGEAPAASMPQVHAPTLRTPVRTACRRRHPARRRNVQPAGRRRTAGGDPRPGPVAEFRGGRGPGRRFHQAALGQGAQERRGRTCHAATMARAPGIPAVVGCANATDPIKPGDEITASCCDGSPGRV